MLFLREAEEAASIFERSAVGGIVSVFPEAKGCKDGGRPWASNRAVSGRDYVGVANRSSMERPARPVPGWFHLLASVMDMGRTRRLAGSRAETAFRVGRASIAELGRCLPRRRVHHREKGAWKSAKHVAGKVRSAWSWSTVGACLSECNLRPRKLPNACSRNARSGNYSLPLRSAHMILTSRDSTGRAIRVGQIGRASCRERV